jgi:hypothetical protein
VRSRGTMGSEVPEEADTSAGVLEVKKRATEDDMASTGEAKRARAEEHSEVPQTPLPLGRREDESGQHIGPKARPTVMDVVNLPCGLQDVAPRKSAGSPLGSDRAMGGGPQSPSGARRFERFGPPPIGQASR